MLGEYTELNDPTPSGFFLFNKEKEELLFEKRFPFYLCDCVSLYVHVPVKVSMEARKGCWIL